MTGGAYGTLNASFRCQCIFGGNALADDRVAAGEDRFPILEREPQCREASMLLLSGESSRKLWEFI